MSDDDDEPHDGKTFRFVCHAKGDVSLSSERVGAFSLPEEDDGSSNEDALERLTQAVRAAYGEELTNSSVVLRGADGSVLCTAEDLRNYVRSVQEHAAARGPIIFFRDTAVGPMQWQVPLRVKPWNSSEAEVVDASFPFSLPWRARPVSHLAAEGEDEEGGVYDDGPLSALRRTCVAALQAHDSPSNRFVAYLSCASSTPGEEPYVTSVATDKQVEEFFAQWVQKRRERAEPNPGLKGSVEEVVEVAVQLENEQAVHFVDIEFVLPPAEGQDSFVPLSADPQGGDETGPDGDDAGQLSGQCCRKHVSFPYNLSRKHGVLNRLKTSALEFLRECGRLESGSSQQRHSDEDHDADWASPDEAAEPLEMTRIVLIAETTACGDIALTNDWAVQNMFDQLNLPSPSLLSSPLASQLTDGSQAPIRIRVGHGESAERTSVAVHCRLREGSSAPGGTSEAHKFTFRFAPDEANLVSQLRSACSAKIGGAPLSAADLLLCTLEDGQEVQIGSDAMLRELLRSHAESEQPIVVTAQRKRKVVVVERLILCQLADDKAQFLFRFVVDDSNLLLSFREECKAELDLLPSDNASLFAQLGPGETVPLAKDSVLREALLANREQPLHVLLVRKPPSGRRGSRTIDPPPVNRHFQRSVECTVGRKKAQFIFSFRIDEEGLLDHLHTCCKQAHGMPIDARVKLVLHHLDANVMCSRDLGTDVQLRDVLADEQEFPTLNITALVVSKRGAGRTDSTPTSASPANPPSRDMNASAGTFSEMDGASLEDSRASTRERRKIQDFDDDSNCDDSSSCPAPTPPAYRRTTSWNDVARDGDSPARVPMAKKPSLYDCFADEADDDSVVRDNSDHGDSVGGPSQRPDGAKRATSSTHDARPLAMDASEGRSGQRNLTAPAESSQKVELADASPTAMTASQQPQLSPSPPPKEKKAAQAHHIRSLGPTSLQPVKKFRVVGDPIVDLIERRMRERRAAEKARREKERQKMDEVMGEIEARRQKHLDELKEFQLLEQRRKQEESEKRAEEIRRREEERLRRIANLKVDPNIILGKKSVLDVLEEKRRKAQHEEEERIIKARVEARERLSWNQHFHQQLDEHQQLVLERVRRREQEKKAHPPILDQPIVPVESADIIKTNAYMRVLSEAHMPQRSAHDKKEELRRQRDVRMSYYDRHLEGGQVPEEHAFEHRPVEYPSRIRGDEAKKEELRKLREARMKYYETHPAPLSGEGSANDADSMNSTPRKRSDSGPAKPVLATKQDESTPAKSGREVGGYHSSQGQQTPPAQPQPPSKQRTSDAKRSRRNHDDSEPAEPQDKKEGAAAVAVLPPIDVGKSEGDAVTTSPSNGGKAQVGEEPSTGQTPRRRSMRKATETSPKASSQVVTEMLPADDPLPPVAASTSDVNEASTDETPRARRRKSRQKDPTPPLDDIPRTVDDDGDELAATEQLNEGEE